MNKIGLTSQSNFERMLDWLNPDREQAGRRYETIRRLIEILASRGCYEAEYWTDQTIDRVVSKIDVVVKDYEGDPAYYFYGVAKKVYLEYLKKKPLAYVPPAPATADEVEREHACLERCLTRLPGAERELILGYYSKELGEKIINRTELARKLEIALNTLRIQSVPHQNRPQRMHPRLSQPRNALKKYIQVLRTYTFEDCFITEGQ